MEFFHGLVLIVSIESICQNCFRRIHSFSPLRPRERATADSPRCRIMYSAFQSAPSWEGDNNLGEAYFYQWQFQSSRPCERATTITTSIIAPFLRFQSAPSREGDLPLPSYYSLFKVFQSAPSREGDLRLPVSLSPVQCFNPRPRERATFCLNDGKSYC